MKEQLSDLLSNGFPSLTRAEKAVASYMLANMSSLPFETAASIADKVGVSQMTVSRFLRSLGYKGLSDLKERMRTEMDTAPLLISDRVNRIRQASEDNRLWDNFELELQAMLGVYELRGTAPWQATVELLSNSSDVFVTAFQTMAGLASDFVERLDYVRPNARFMDSRNGTFSELLGGTAASPCLLLFEMRRYTRLSHHLLRAARESGIPIVIICDNHCYWARDYTDNVLSVRTNSLLFWDSQTPFLSLANLLFDDVIARLGDRVAERIRAMRVLQDRFGAFQD